MPTYTFTTESGKPVELFMTMDEAPAIGQETVIAGQTLLRVVDQVHVAAVADKHFTSRSLPRWDPSAPRHNAAGQPQFTSNKEVTEYVKKTGGNWVYD